jgi:hypothetical protein
MASTTKVTYWLKRTLGDVIYLQHTLPGFDFGTAENILHGGAWNDTLFVGSGVRVDARVMGSGNDSIYFTGNLSDYTQSIDQDTGVYTFTHITRPTEVVKITSMGEDDKLYFKDGHILFNANSDSRLYDENNGGFKPVEVSHLTPGGTPDDTPNATVTINGISADTGVSSSDFITTDADGLTITATLSRALNEVSSQGVMTAGAPAQVYIKGIDGVDIPHLRSSGQAMKVVGGAGDDSVYVGKGVAVDARVMGAGSDRIYFTGNLNDYNQVIEQDTGVYTFTHKTRSTEVVKLTSMGENDELWFADGHIVFNAIDDARLYDENTGVFQQVDASWLSAGGTPLATERLEYSNDGGVTWQDVSSSVTGTAVMLNDPTLTSTSTIKFRVVNQTASGAEATQLVTIDTVADEAAIAGRVIAVTAITSDTGVSNSDFITSDQTLVISGTSDASNGANVAVKINGTIVGYTTVTGGVWSYNHTGTVLAAGNYTLDADLVDAAGNVAATAADRALTVDIVANEAAIAGKVIAVTAITSDTGVSNSDFITNDQTLVISGTSDASNGANVAVKVNGTIVGYTTVTGGVWSYNHTGTVLAAGNYTLDADLVDVAGNVAATAVDRALTVDTVANEAAIAGRVIAVTAISGDTGVSNSDFITNDQTLVISGTSNADNGANVAVKVNGAIVGYTTVTGGVWSFDYTGTVLAAGGYTLDADLVDVAGNVAATAVDQAIVVDTVANEAAIAGRVIAVTAISNDTGVLGNDFITSDQTLVISGTSDASNGANVAVKVNGTIVGYTTVTGGVWSFDYTGTALAAGNYTLDADLVDVAGNVAATAVDRALVVDTSGTTDAAGAADTAIAGKVIAVTAISGDTGVSNSDFITNDQTLVISGTSDASNGANVAVKVNGAIVGYTTVTGGVWSYNHTGTVLAAGNYTLDADLVDAAGNVAATAVDRALTVDTVADEAAIAGRVIAVTAISNDTGVLGNDFITSDQTLVISGTSDASNGANVAVKVNGAIVGYTTVTGGVWSYNHTGTTLAAGNYTLDADLVDAAGNVAATAVDRALVVDTSGTTDAAGAADTAIAGKVIAVTAISGDTGVSNSDFITNDQTLVISGTSDADNGANVAVKVNGTIVGYTTVTGGAWSFNHTGTVLAAGNYTLDADLVDAAGNVAATAADRALVVDTSGATDATGNPDTDIAGKVIAVTAISGDTGVSNSDFITSDQTLVISGTSDASNGANVAVKVNGAIVGYTTVTGGVWSFNHTGTVLAAGNYTLDADLVDAAGNIAATAVNQALVVDTSGTTDAAGAADTAIAGKVIAVTAISGDTGVSNSDFITNDQTLVISGTSDASNGAHVAVKVNGTIVGYTTVTGGVWSFNHTGTVLAAGNYTLDADLVDAAGNVAASATDRALVVDTSGTTDAAGAADTAIAGKVIAVTAISGDTGVSNSDFITNDQTLVISGTSDASNGANVAVKVNGAIVGYTTVTGGVWSYNHTGTVLAAGNYTLDADLVDAAGNVAATAVDRALVVDTSGTTDAAGAADTAIAGKVIAVTAISGDTGVSNSDFITNDQTLVISGTSDASNGANVAVKVNGAIVGYTTVTGGVWSFDYTGTALAAGNYTLDADLVDAAGNIAATAVNQALVVDTSGTTDAAGAADTAIAGKVIAVTAISGDTGVSNSDFITNDQTLVISGTSDASNGANVAVKVNGAIVGYTTVTGGVWSYNHTGTVLAAGNYTLDADLVDAAGNVAATATDRALVVDTSGTTDAAGAADTAIAGRVIAVTAISNDTGVLGTDFITSDQTLVISGTSDASNGAHVAVKVNGAIVGYTTVTGGVWSFDYTGTALTAGGYTLDADLVDAAGNIAATAVDRALVVDTVADEAAIAGKVIAVTAISGDTGVSNSDFITNDQTLVISGTSDASNGANVAVKVNGAIVGYTTVTGGVWSFDYTGTALAAGNYTLDADLVDAAGNIAATAVNQALVVDTSGTTDAAGAADTAIAGKVIAVTAISGDTGVSNSDFITNDQTLVISGTSDASNGANVAVKVNGAIVGYTTVTGGVWSYNHTGTVLAAGNYTLDADLVDAAGNVAATATDRALVVDTSGTTDAAGAADTAIAGKVIAVTAISGDTGVSNSDFITNDQTLVISGTSDASNGANVAVKVNGAIVGYTTVTGGVWSYNHTGTVLAAGNYTLDADLVDAAGNVAATATDRALVVDTSGTTDAAGAADTAIAGKVIAVTAISGDTGVSNSDFITNDQTLVISGTSDASNGANVAVKVNGAIVGYTTVTGGVWSFDYTGTVLATGNYTLDADLVDAAGNVAATATDRALVVDTSGTTDAAGAADTAIVGKVIAVTAISGDTGVSNSDFITNDQTLVISGTSDASNGANVAVKVNGAIVGYTTVTGGVWSYNHTGTVLAAGNYTLDADLVDAAGNVAATAADRALTVDTVADEAAIAGKVIAVTAVSDDTGVLGNDFITNDQTLIISGTSNADNGAHVAVKIDGNIIGYTTVTAGAWSFDYTGTSLAAGNYTLDADLVDVAGNVAATAADRALTVDTTLELLATPLDGLANLDVKSALVLEFSQDISLGSGQIRILDQMGTNGWTITNTTTGMSRQDVTDNDVIITLTAGVVTGMTIGGVDYTALGTNGISLAKLQASVSISGNKLIIDPAGLDSASGTDWDFDFDFGADYRLEIDANLVKTQNGLINFAGISGGTGIDFTTVTPVGNNTGAASQKMDANGDLQASYIYHHGHAGDAAGLDIAMNFSSGSHVLVIETGGGTSKNLGVGALGGHITLTGFGADDLIYNDNLGNMAMLTTDGVHAASWTGSAGMPAERYQNGTEQQKIVFTDYASKGWTYMGNLNYGQADGRFEDAAHNNFNAIIFG